MSMYPKERHWDDSNVAKANSAQYCKQQTERCGHCLHNPLYIRAAIGSATSAFRQCLRQLLHL